ncbi:MAG: L-threonylcarbamoyladenylate synthase [Actinobacteria bacterium]|nr:L-threonylcarbamoyladenylate synthase [Actinomycetota bacterium]
MKIIRLNSKERTSRDAAGIAAKYISAGKVVILPTSTIYGLSCSYDNRSALERTYELKQRPKNLPFIVLISKIDSLLQLADEIKGTADILIKKYWTGQNTQPLTLVFKKNNSLDSFVAGGNEKIAIRLDGLEILKKIIELSGPIVSTSATISGLSLSPKNINEIPEAIKKNTDLIIDYGEDLPGTASTIIDVAGPEAVLIREGALKYDKVFDELF